MRKSTIILAGKDYEVVELRSRESEAWRKKLENIFTEVADIFALSPDTDFTPAFIAGLIRSASGVLIKSIDRVRDLLFEYSPELAADKDAIMASSYDSEILDAFTEVLKLAYPFGILFQAIKATGSTIQKTGRN